MSTPSYDASLVLDFSFFSGVNAAGDIPDFSGYRNDGTPVNFVGDDSEFIDGHLGQSIRFPGGGADKHLNCGNDSSIANVRQVTVEAIFTQTTVGTNQHLVSKFAFGGNLTYLLILLAGGQYQFFVGGAVAANAATTGAIATAGQIYHLIGTSNGYLTQIYLNGIWIDDAATPLAPVVSPSDLLIAIQDTNINDAAIDMHRSRIWSRHMGADEIYERYIHAKRR